LGQGFTFWKGCLKVLCPLWIKKYVTNIGSFVGLVKCRLYTKNYRPSNNHDLCYCKPLIINVVIIIIIIHEYYYGVAVALLLQDQLTMSVTEQSQYLSATVQWKHKTLLILLCHLKCTLNQLQSNFQQQTSGYPLYVININ